MAVRDYCSGEAGLKTIAQRHNVDVSSLRQWIAGYRAPPPMCPPSFWQRATNARARVSYLFAVCAVRSPHSISGYLPTQYIILRLLSGGLLTLSQVAYLCRTPGASEATRRDADAVGRGPGLQRLRRLRIRGRTQLPIVQRGMGIGISAHRLARDVDREISTHQFLIGQV